MKVNKVGLLILDGWGIGPDYNADAIATANTPFFDKIMAENPHSTLTTFGEEVGLPDGQMGNSEVGHLNLGAGRIVYQELARINKAIRTKELDDNPEIKAMIDHVKTTGGTLHLLGLVSDGGVHSHLDHLIAICEILKKNNVGKVAIHAFMDGRDTDPKMGKEYIQKLLKALDGTSIKLVSLCGRYYSMDRDKRWERVKKAYDLLVHGAGAQEKDPIASLEKSYANHITDEFIEPTWLGNAPDEYKINPEDTVFFYNFRTDRPRQLTEVLSQTAKPDFHMSPLPLYFVTMTEYDAAFQNIRVVFKTDNLNKTIGEVIAHHGLKQLRIAETEKYPHVTFFFSGGRETPFENEDRILCPSPKVATYDLQPEMSANEITSSLLEYWTKSTPEFICLNFANTDMVGHTGVFNAGVVAAETVDHCLEKIVTKGRSLGYSFIVLADHGNADCMINPDGTPNTAHTKNPVPVIYLGDRDVKIKSGGKLGDVAPTILTLMGLEIPEEMGGNVLIGS